VAVIRDCGGHGSGGRASVILKGKELYVLT